MARTVEEYKTYIEENLLQMLMVEGWENLIDNTIDYDGIDYPDESERGTVWYDRKYAEAEHKWEVEEQKAVEALAQYLGEMVWDTANGRIRVLFDPKVAAATLSVQED